MCHHKKSLLFIFPVLCLILTLGCRPVPPGDYQSELARSWNVRGNLRNQPIPFTLSYPGMEGIPVVAVELDGQIYHLIIDTGASGSTLFKPGIEKCFGNLGAFSESMLPAYIEHLENRGETISNDLTSEGKKRLASQLMRETKEWNGHNFTLDFTITEQDSNGRATVHSHAFRFILYSDTFLKNELLDGVVGRDIMETFGKITFDYQRKVIKLGGVDIEGSELSMERWGELFLIPIIVNGREERALVDTGAGIFTVPDDWKKKLATTSLNSFFFNRYQVCIANFLYTGMNPYKISSPFVVSAPGAKASLKYPLLGYPFWKDRIIQLDFESNIFRIQ